MSRQIAFITVIAVALTAILLASQPHLIDSVLMNRLVPRRARSYLANVHQARRAFTPYSPTLSTFTPPTTMSSAKIEDANETAGRTSDVTCGSQDPAEQNDGKPLPLPPPPSEEEAMKLDMSSGEASVKVDHLGPLVVNKDGTLSRIGNWQQMTELEKKNTLRILGKRNQLRTSALQEAEAAAASEQEK